MDYFIPIALFAGLGLAAGILLTVFSKLFGIGQNQALMDVKDALPSINCGACGFSGCDGYAEAVCKGEKLNLCIPGGDETARKLSTITGREFEAVIPLTAVVRCNGCRSVTGDKYDYQGEMSCAACAMYFGGRGRCHIGCIGLGDCVKKCIYGAIHIVHGIAVVDRKLCAGCKMCISSCPQGLFDVHDACKTIEVTCSSTDTPKQTRLSCAHGCIACRRCEKTCKVGAIKIKDNHASIDHQICTNCGDCLNVCPVQCISNHV